MRELKRNWVLFLAVTAVSLPLAARAEEGQTSRPDTVIPAEKLYEQWWSDRHEANKARIAEGNVDLLLLGDSITHHWDDAGRKVEEYYYGDRHSVNMGFGGDRTQHLLWRLIDAPMDKIHPKAAMILIGINNIRANTEEEIAQGIKANVDKMVTLYPDIKILLLAIFPINGHDDPMRGKIAATNALLPEM
ncbi:MAG: GDSL family lipase, partial [Thermoguttaceae bacterium]|nr:GDSL family lipase [Thermoguttaceae bacterium]